MIKLFEKINESLINSSIHNRLNANMLIRLKQYKDTKKLTEEYINWRLKHENKLDKSWQSYVNVVGLITYSKYCEDFYNGKLNNIFPSSYKGKFKN